MWVYFEALLWGENFSFQSAIRTKNELPFVLDLIFDVSEDPIIINSWKVIYTQRLHLLRSHQGGVKSETIFRDWVDNKPNCASSLMISILWLLRHLYAIIHELCVIHDELGARLWAFNIQQHSIKSKMLWTIGHCVHRTIYRLQLIAESKNCFDVCERASGSLWCMGNCGQAFNSAHNISPEYMNPLLATQGMGISGCKLKSLCSYFTKNVRGCNFEATTTSQQLKELLIATQWEWFELPREHYSTIEIGLETRAHDNINRLPSSSHKITEVFILKN